mmetsp:Transcript_50597/g.89918  ORF Transcript_50597/g.89918 Transcript_50597/m.89918 type:complete len:115 (-) Transcript_50597:600-944(-)
MMRGGLVDVLVVYHWEAAPHRFPRKLNYNSTALTEPRQALSASGSRPVSASPALLLPLLLALLPEVCQEAPVGQAGGGDADAQNPQQVGEARGPQEVQLPITAGQARHREAAED